MTHEGTVNVIKAVEEEMKKELKSKDTEDFNALPTEEEKEFLKYIPVYSWTPEEVAELNKETTAAEVMNILEKEVDLDSAPGEDGITYRIIKKLMNNHKFRDLYIDYLNFTRRVGGCGSAVSNTGIMVVKNKKSQSIE